MCEPACQRPIRRKAPAVPAAEAADEVPAEEDEAVADGPIPAVAVGFNHMWLRKCFERWRQ